MLKLVLLVLCISCAGCNSLGSRGMDEKPTSPALSFQLSDDELMRVKGSARAGDCSAALKVAHHYSFVKNDFDSAISWLRLAAKCPDSSPKAELVYMLLGYAAKPEIDEEIDRLIAAIHLTNPSLAGEVRAEVERRRR